MMTEATGVGIQYARSWNGYYVRNDGVYVGQVWMNFRTKGDKVVRGWSATDHNLLRVGGVFSTRQKAAQALASAASRGQS